MRASIALLMVLFCACLVPAQATEETFLPAESAVITADNAERLKAVAEIGAGWQRLLSLSPDGNFVAMQDERGVAIFDVLHPEVPARRMAQNSHLMAVEFNPDWSWMAVYDGKAISLISLKTGHQFRKINFWADSMSFNQMLVSPDGKEIAIHTGWDSGSIDIWSAETGEVVYPGPDDWVGDWECRYTISNPIYSQDSHTFAFVCGELDTMGDLHSMNFWEFIGMPPVGLPGYIQDYPPDVPYQFTQGIASRNAYIGMGFWVIRKDYDAWKVWDLLHERLALEMPAHYEFQEFRPKAAERDDEALFYDKLAQRFALLNLQTLAITPLMAGRQPVRTLWNADGSAFVSMEDASTLRVIHVSTEEEHTLSLGERIGTIDKIVFNHEGTIAYFSEDKINIRSLDLQTSHLDIFASIPYGTGLIAYDPLRDQIAVGTTQGTIELWDTATKQRLEVLKAHDSRVKDLLFSSDGQFLASYGTDHALRVRDLTTHRLILLDHYKTDSSIALAFDPHKPSHLSAYVPSSMQSRFTVYDVKKDSIVSQVEYKYDWLSPEQIIYHNQTPAITIASHHRVNTFLDGVVPEVKGIDEAGVIIPIEWQTMGLSLNPQGDVLAVDEIFGWTGPVQITLFDSLTGKTLNALPDEWETAMVFSPDGRFLITARSGKAIIWGIPPIDK